MKNLFILTAAAILSAGHSFAVQCGDTVTGDVTLTQDLTCNATTALIVGANNTTIHLNGHTMTCVGIGPAGSCQVPVGGAHSGTYGVKSVNHSNVQVLGPGVINGFECGVWLEGGGGNKVNGVTITGPTFSKAANTRWFAYGITVQKAYCPISIFGQDKSPSVSLWNNQISNQTSGIEVSDSSCVEIKSNTIHDIANSTAAPNGVLAVGLGVHAASHNMVSYNVITAVGYNKQYESGIYDRDSSYNTYMGNNVSSNCGNGVLLLFAKHTTVSHNVMRFNGTTGLTNGACNIPAPNTLFDLSAFDSGANNGANSIDSSNVCRTQAGNVPAGVCNAGE